MTMLIDGAEERVCVCVCVDVSRVRDRLCEGGQGQGRDGAGADTTREQHGGIRIRGGGKRELARQGMVCRYGNGPMVGGEEGGCG